MITRTPTGYQIKLLKGLSESILLRTFGQKPGFCFLDGADVDSAWSSYRLFVCRPFLSLCTRSGKTTVSFSGGGSELVEDNPFDVLESYLARFSFNSDDRRLPFLGGAIGFVSYEAARYLEDFSFILKEGVLPDSYFGFYHQAVIKDIKKNEWWGVSMEGDFSEGILDVLETELGAVSLEESVFEASNIQTLVSKEAYSQGFSTIKEYIRQGDIYQANYSIPFQVPVSGDSLIFYDALRKANPVPYSAFMNTGDAHIFSLSPELFMKVDGRRVVTRPIKGTVARGQNSIEDEKQLNWLLNSLKDKAELTMIVDLERNDLGRVCDYGSVVVSEERVIESYETVHHGVASVEGYLKEGVGALDVFKTLFPGGSITGAPKIRAMEILSDIEPYPRSIYTGAIGYVGFDGRSQFNIAIRTLYRFQDQLYFHSGGGIVVDSRLDTEWDELQEKVRGICDVLDLF